MGSPSSRATRPGSPRHAQTSRYTVTWKSCVTIDNTDVKILAAVCKLVAAYVQKGRLSPLLGKGIMSRILQSIQIPGRV